VWCKKCNRESVARYRNTPEGGEKHRAREKARFKANPAPVRERLNAWRAANLEHARAANNAARLRRMKDPEYRKKENARISKWAKENKVRVGAKTKTNRMLRARAQPKWLSAIQKAQIQEFYEIAAARNIQTGIKHHVDHIFAVKATDWRGLHVPWNLQVMTATENDEKWIKVPKEFEHQLWNPQKHVRSGF